jgi:hypothetical protein
MSLKLSDSKETRYRNKKVEIDRVESTNEARYHRKDKS